MPSIFCKNLENFQMGQRKLAEITFIGIPKYRPKERI